MELSAAVKGRRSIRSYKPNDVSEEEIEMLIEAATFAPSAGNIQPWEFIVVRNPERKEQLAIAAHEQSFMEQAPVVIIVCANEILSSQGYGVRGKNLFCLQDTAAAIQNMLLTAYSLGLGTCWIGAFEEDEVSEVLRIPKGVRPVALVPVGYPAKIGILRTKRRMEQLVHHELF
jgi:nitroreductase